MTIFEMTLAVAIGVFVGKIAYDFVSGFLSSLFRK